MLKSIYITDVKVLMEVEPVDYVTYCTQDEHLDPLAFIFQDAKARREQIDMLRLEFAKKAAVIIVLNTTVYVPMNYIVNLKDKLKYF